MKRFTPIKEFTWKDNSDRDAKGRVRVSVYVPGLTYTVRDGNEKLDELTQQWMIEGKIQFIE